MHRVAWLPAIIIPGEIHCGGGKRLYKNTYSRFSLGKQSFFQFSGGGGEGGGRGEFYYLANFHMGNSTVKKTAIFPRGITIERGGEGYSLTVTCLRRVTQY